jgi:hypothetical protein
VALAALLAACRTPTDAGPPPMNLVGAWQYDALQGDGSGTTISGTVTVTDQRGHELSGAYDVVERDTQGNTDRYAGPVSGLAVDSVSLDFDLLVYGVQRRHVAKRVADTVSGQWYDQTIGPLVASGTFRMVRRSTP